MLKEVTKKKFLITIKNMISLRYSMYYFLQTVW